MFINRYIAQVLQAVDGSCPSFKPWLHHAWTCTGEVNNNSTSSPAPYLLFRLPHRGISNKHDLVNMPHRPARPPPTRPPLLPGPRGVVFLAIFVHFSSNLVYTVY